MRVVSLTTVSESSRFTTVRYVRIHQHLHSLIAGLLEEGDQPCEDFRARSGLVDRTDLSGGDDDVTGHRHRVGRIVCRSR